MKGLFLAIVALALLALSGCSRSYGGGTHPAAGKKSGPPYEMLGFVSAPECGGGYNLEHAAVTVKDEHGTIIGATTTGAGTVASGQCSVSFDASLPRAAFYQLTVGSHGAPTYSFDELKAKNWLVTLSLN